MFCGVLMSRSLDVSYSSTVDAMLMMWISPFCSAICPTVESVKMRNSASAKIGFCP